MCVKAQICGIGNSSITSAGGTGVLVMAVGGVVAVAGSEVAASGGTRNDLWAKSASLLGKRPQCRLGTLAQSSQSHRWV